MMTNKLQTSPKTTGGHTAHLRGFIGLTFGLTLLTWGVLAVLQISVASAGNTDAQTSPLAMVLYLLGGLTPSIAGFVMAYRVNGRAGLRGLWRRFRQVNLGAGGYLTIMGVPALIAASSLLAHTALGGAIVRPAFLQQPVSLLASAIPILIFGPLSEEFGWRGFAQDLVQTRWGSVRGSIFLGLVWAFWHLPLFFIPGAGQQATGNPALNFPIYVIHVIGITVLMTWLYNRTGRSLWGAVLFHFMLNFAGFVLLQVSDMTPQFMYLANAVVTVLLAAVVLLRTSTFSEAGAPSPVDEPLAHTS